MATSDEAVKAISRKYLERSTLQQLKEQLQPRSVDAQPLEASLPSNADIAKQGLQIIRQSLQSQGKQLPLVTGERPVDFSPDVYARNIENYIGNCSIPVGVAGPLRVNGLNARGDFIVPLATTEAALVASFHRGCKAITLSGGVSAACLVDKMGRAPIFVFKDLTDALVFCSWVVTIKDQIREVAEKTSRFAKLVDFNIVLNGQDVALFLEFSTGDAAGQNMVTLASDAACKHIVEHSPVPVLRWCIESNMSGDKKATILALNRTRGKKVVAEVRIPEQVCLGVLKARPIDLYNGWKISTMSSVKTGSIGNQIHFANGLTALFIATGQDVACISESSVGVTDYSVEEDGSLMVNVCLPNLVVGSVGGGTGLPTQRECLELLGCAGAGGAAKLAEICAGLALAGEISIIAAISAGHFTQAHHALARGPKK